MRRAGRFLLQIVILVVMLTLASIDNKLFVNLVAITLIPLPAINWTVALILIWTARQAPDIQSLVERADDAVTLALVSTAGGVVGLSVVARALGLPNLGSTAIALLGFAMVLVSVPALGWLSVWRHQWLPIIRKRRE